MWYTTSNACHRSVERPTIANVSCEQLDAHRAKIAPAGGVPHERPHPASARDQPAREVATGEPRGAGYEGIHRSATIVTGEPKSLPKPIRSSTASIATVK